MLEYRSGVSHAPGRSRTTPSWRPVGTQSLIALNLTVFFLQWLWGATSTPPLLAGMGGMVSSRISDGEWWRLFSCTVLHGSFMHVGLNCFVLYVLGSFTERVIGTGRFLVLYVVSGVCASIGSFFWTDAVSVGASGAVFGLLGAQGVLAYFPRGLLPDAILPSARRAATTNLLLNIGVSFMPNVDAAAHFTGAIVGAGLVFAGMVTPKVSTPPRQQLRLLRSWLLGGIAATVGYASIAAFGVLQGMPWLYTAPIVFENRVLPGSEQTHQFPTFLPPARLAAEADLVQFGSDDYFPYRLLVEVRRGTSSTEDSGAYHQQARRELRAIYKLPRDPVTTTVRGHRITCATAGHPAGPVAEHCALVDGPYAVTLLGLSWPGEMAQRYDSLTLEIASRWWTRAGQD